MELIVENWRRFLTESLKSSHLVLMKPQDFLTLTRGEGDAVEARADYINKNLGGFDRNKAGTLSLTLKRCRGVPEKVINHEGRARAMAAMKSGLTEYPVAITVVNCQETRKMESSELYISSPVVEAQFTKDTVSVSSLVPYKPDDMLGLGQSTSIADEDLRKLIRVEFYGKATDTYRMTDYVNDLNNEYTFTVDGQPRELIIGKSVRKSFDGAKRFGGLREPVLALDPNDIDSYPDPEIKVQVVKKQ